MGHGWEGVVLKLFRGKDFVFTVTGAEQVTEHYRRVHFTDGGLLEATGVHPTMWVRLWFDNAGKPHQRAYTLVDPDPAAGTFSLEFALHDGCASDWARKAQPGDTIEATVQGTGFELPDPLPDADPGHRRPGVAAGDQLAARRSRRSCPATIWFETAHDADHGLPFRIDPDAPRTAHGRRGAGALVEEVKADLPELSATRPAHSSGSPATPPPPARSRRTC